MGRSGYYIFCLILISPLVVGCDQGNRRSSSSSSSSSSPFSTSKTPIIRVRLLQDQSQILISASESPITRIQSERGARRLDLPRGQDIPLSLTPAGWQIGNVALGSGIMRIEPDSDGSFLINRQAYRGDFRLVPLANGKFDVINDLDVESYLKGVIARELYPKWEEETYMAQAITARTYALYESKAYGMNRHWDVYPDQRSQVYGGMAAETQKSRRAVEHTAGVVLAYGLPGHEKIFKAYFSSCCGGVSMSAYDTFGDGKIEPLTEQNVGLLCSSSTRFRWGPISIPKEEITRRFRLWGTRTNRSEQRMATVAAIDILATNRYGRPTWFVVTDEAGRRYSLQAEQLRYAVNTDAQEGTTLFSGFVRCAQDPDDPQSLRFIDGRGFGHGVGMCQWCAQTRALRGMAHEDILVTAFRGAKLVHAY